MQDADEPVEIVGGKEILKCLIGVHPRIPIGQSMLNYAQVLEGIVTVAEGLLPKQVAVVNAGDEAKSQVLGFQPEAQLLLALTYSADHWTLLCVDKRNIRNVNKAAAVTYSGLPDIVSLDHASAFLNYLVERGWLEQAKVPHVVAAAVPLQQDAWSCGHRVILSASHVVRAVKLQQPVPSVLDDTMISMEAIKQLFQVEPTPPPMGASDSESDSPRVQVTRCSRISHAKKKAKIKNIKKEEHEEPLPADASEASAAIQRPLSKEERKQMAQVSADAGVTHAYFQKLHYEQKQPPPSGHWSLYLDGLFSDKVMTCAICSEMKMQVRQPCKPCQPCQPQQIQQQTPDRNVGQACQALPIQHGLESDMSDIPGMPCASVVQQPEQVSQDLVLGPKVSRKGRPSKMEQAKDRWDIHVFIRLNRSCIYMQTKDSYLSGKIIYWCNPCKRHIQFQSRTDPEPPLHQAIQAVSLGYLGSFDLLCFGMFWYFWVQHGITCYNMV
jgi:hypothetical protein